MTHATTIAFSKMNGLGNDFVILDARQQKLSLTPEHVRALAARDNPTTHGCDQLLVVQAPREGSDIFMQIFNQDGSEVEACGNGTRAVAAYLQAKHGLSDVQIDTLGGLLHCHTPASSTDAFVPSVAMPLPVFGWQDVPLSAQLAETSAVDLHEDLPPAFMVNVGNPHAVIFVEGGHAATAQVARDFGAHLETLSLFSDRANINIASLIDPQTIRLDTWERGVGLTQACGTGACATVVAAIEKGLSDADTISVRPPANQDDNHRDVITISYQSGRQLTMSGPVVFEFDATTVLEAQNG